MSRYPISFNLVKNPNFEYVKSSQAGIECIIGITTDGNEITNQNINFSIPFVGCLAILNPGVLPDFGLFDATSGELLTDSTSNLTDSCFTLIPDKRYNIQFSTVASVPYANVIYIAFKAIDVNLGGLAGYFPFNIQQRNNMFTYKQDIYGNSLWKVTGANFKAGEQVLLGRYYNCTGDMDESNAVEFNSLLGDVFAPIKYVVKKGESIAVILTALIDVDDYSDTWIVQGSIFPTYSATKFIITN